MVSFVWTVDTVPERDGMTDGNGLASTAVCIASKTPYRIVIKFCTGVQGSYYFAEFIFPDFSRQNE